MNALTRLFFFCLFFICLIRAIHAEPLSLSVTDIDSLRCPPRDSLLQHIRNATHFDTHLQRQQLNKALVTYSRLQSLQEELAILHSQQKNLELIHGLLIQKQERAEIADLDVLQSQQQLFNKEMTIISHRFQIQKSILELANLAHIKLKLKE